jgi:tetratricopeptide (TPR) repeat protein
MGDYKSAKDGYQKALEIQKKHFGEDHIEYATCLGNLSGVLRNMGDYKSAKDGYQKALEISRNITERTTLICFLFRESLRSFGGYGRLQVSQGRLSEGIRNLQETLRRRPLI